MRPYRIIEGEAWYSGLVINEYIEVIEDLEDMCVNAQAKSDKYFNEIERLSARILELENQLNKKWWQFWK